MAAHKTSSSIVKGVRKESHSDHKRSNVEVGTNGDDDLHPVKHGSSVWRSGVKGGKQANTYRMAPKRKFHPHLILKKGEELLSRAFGELADYDHDKCRGVAEKVAADLLAFIKEQRFQRYRYVVSVTVGDKRGQAVKIASRALWDEEKDNFLTLNFENENLFAVGTVFAIYFE